MPKFSPEEIAAAKAKHGALFKSEIGEDEFFFRAPTFEEYQSYLKTMIDEETRHDATRVLVRDVMVLPAVADFDAMVREFPGVPMTLGREVQRIASKGGKATEAKKV
jgi:hypothetical protein